MRRILTPLLVLFVTSVGLGQRPLLIPYQGFLTDTAGNPVPDGSVSMNFALYNRAEGGSSLWAESRSVLVESGIFHVYLGTQTPIPPELFDKQLWLGIEVDTDGEMEPRTLLGVAPYSVSPYDTTEVAGLGEPCSNGLECLSGFCTDGVCCDEACGDLCETCDGSAAGTCEPAALGTDPDSQCGDYYCDGGGSCSATCISDEDCKTTSFCDTGSLCQPKLADGLSCSDPWQCINGHCPPEDSVCCSTACVGVCLTCDGSIQGQCELALELTDPRSDCGAYYCDGAGSCMTSCTGSFECKSGFTCDGGFCVAS